MTTDMRVHVYEENEAACDDHSICVVSIYKLKRTFVQELYN